MFMTFGSGTEDLDGVLGAAGVALVGCVGAAREILLGVVRLLSWWIWVVTLAASTFFGTPMFNRSSSTDSTGVVGKARPEGADDEVERVLFEGKGSRLATVEGVGREGRTGTIMVGSGLMGVGVAGCALSSQWEEERMQYRQYAVAPVRVTRAYEHRSRPGPCS